MGQRHSGTNAAAIGQDVARDHFDQRERKLTIWLSSGQERDVLIRTDVPRHPDARAGRYNLIVEVTTEIPPQQAASAARQNQSRRLRCRLPFCLFMSGRPTLPR